MQYSPLNPGTGGGQKGQTHTTDIRNETNAAAPVGPAKDYDDIYADHSPGDVIGSYVATFPSDDPAGIDGACDVEIRLMGSDDDGYIIRTTDDAGGGNDLPAVVYRTCAEAEAAAETWIESHDEADGQDAETYLDSERQAVADEGRDDQGEYCLYWETVSDDAGPRERYATREAAEAATALASDALHATHPGTLLCGFGVRQLVDGEWVQVGE